MAAASQTHRAAEMALPQAEVNWESLDKTKFYLVGAGLFSGVSAVLYPITVIKTRLQVVGADSVHKTAGTIIRQILSTEGIRGLYRGFGIVITGAIPSRMVFMTSLETTKAAALRLAEKMELHEASAAAFANGAAGLVSSMASQTVFVPLDVTEMSGIQSLVDYDRFTFATNMLSGVTGICVSYVYYSPSIIWGVVSVFAHEWWSPHYPFCHHNGRPSVLMVSQRLMVQGTVGTTHYNGSLDAVKQIVKADGVRGLYRGFGMSVLTYSPSSAVWWAAYGSSQRVIWRSLGVGNGEEFAVPSQSKMVFVQAAGGIFAAAVSSVATTPMDTIKTRLQVLKGEGGGAPTIAQTVKSLTQENGWKGFYKGLGPRFVSMSLWGTSMITTYEFLKRFSIKQEE